MFLEFLNRHEKENFLDLAYYVAHCDSDFASAEKKWIRTYRNEMNLNNHEVKNRDLDTIIEDFSDSSFLSKTSILLEIMDLILSDYNYDGNEQKVVQKLRESWKINNEQFESIVFWLKDKHLIFQKEKEKII